VAVLYFPIPSEKERRWEKEEFKGNEENRNMRI